MHTRRDALATIPLLAASLVRPGLAGAALAPPTGKVVKNGRLKQSAARWCYSKIPLPDLCKAGKEMGLAGIDLLDEKEWPVALDHGLTCSLVWKFAGSSTDGINEKKAHDVIVKGYEEMLPKMGKAGLPNAIAFFGQRRPGLSDSEARDNSIACLQRIKPAAEASKVTVCVEVLNSKVDHKGYQGDHTSYCLDVVKAVDSPYVKLLYDIYHAQIMDGDIIRTIRDNKKWIGHYHTGGVPGRHEIDDTQELNWRTIAKAIVDTGYTGYFSHEFMPKGDPLKSLREAVALCDV